MTDISYIKSPFNYMGSKYKLLSQIIPLFPKDINTFMDVFGGAFNVGINVQAKKFIYNDIQYALTDLLENLYVHSIEDIDNKICQVISDYNNLKDDTDYYELRTNYNITKDWVKLFVLSCYSFNYSFRFNSKGEFNMPSGIGVSHYNKRIQENLRLFVEELKKKQIEFKRLDFRELKLLDSLESNDFVYFDPPYIISDVRYYDKYKWKEKDERDLLYLIDKLNDKGVKFALSNVLKHKGLENDLLKDWISKYKVYKLDNNYKSTWNAVKKKSTNKEETIEIIVTNY